MEEGTALVLALQLLALAAIAAALLLYLLCRLRGPQHRHPASPATSPLAHHSGSPMAVLVTHADSALGLQVALWLASRGFRVFAGLKEPEGEGPAAATCRAWTKAREGLQEEGEREEEGKEEEEGKGKGWLQTLRLDACKEDQLHEAAGAVRGRLPAAEDGLWAVVHVGGGGGGGACRGRLETQQSAHWERLLREHVVGALRAARALLPLLRSQKGRLLLLGGGKGGDEGGKGGNNASRGLVAWSAARAAVEGAASALRAEVAPVRVITLRPHASLAPEALFAPPTWRCSGSALGAVGVDGDDDAEAGGRGRQEPSVAYEVLGRESLLAIEDALLSARPKHAYPLLPPAPPRPSPLHFPCSSTSIATRLLRAFTALPRDK